MHDQVRPIKTRGYCERLQTCDRSHCRVVGGHRLDEAVTTALDAFKKKSKMYGWMGSNLAGAVARRTEL